MSDTLPERTLSGAAYSIAELLEGNDVVLMLDQLRLPNEERYIPLRTCQQMADAIRSMVVRGAPALGIAAAYGMVLAARTGMPLDQAAALLKATRPTAVHVASVVDQMGSIAAGLSGEQLVRRLAAWARQLHQQDVANNRRLGKFGAERLGSVRVVLTHCNAGALATGGYGSALGVIRAAREAGGEVRVLADETRPYLQGARLTAWELAKDGIPVEVITDNSAGWFFSRGEIDAVVVGADRIAANGDVANKIGTYSVACLARMHEVPFFVAAACDTIDMACASGEHVPIEQRAAREVTHIADCRMVPDGVQARYAGFDVTPARLVTAIFTERGVVEPVGPETIRRVVAAGPPPVAR
ncbi:MAG: S-methyl-5-thioribose-1-phosphate isomerase [Polyangiaceae bacterium]|nr:S-methyl-5-thioribose-1-phosphate isomerase [Polyangiaceae bacterium]